jgi:flagellar hook protein FlgE
MSLWGAFSDSVEAIQAQSNALAVIAQNVGNVNTTGYKQTTTNFSTVLSESTVGTNIFGVQDVYQHNNDVQGNFQSTGIWDNLALNGPGFFILNSATDGSGATSFTRAGDFAEAVVGTNSQYAYLTDGQGNYLMGMAGGNAAASTSTSGLTAVKFAIGSTLAGSPTTQIALQGSLPSDATVSTPIVAAAQELETQLTTTNTQTTPGFDPTTTQVYNTGTLQIQTGTLDVAGGTFTPGGAAVTVNVTDGSLQGVASAINAAGAGVTASVVQDTTGNYQLQISGNTIGAANGFTIAGADAGGTAQSLASLDYSNDSATQNNTDFSTVSQAQDSSAGAITNTTGVPIYDNSGNTQTLALNFTKVGSDSWQVTYSTDPNVATITSANSTTTPSATLNPTVLQFDGAGNFLSQSGSSSVNISWADGTTSTIDLDFSKMSQLASGQLIVNAATQNGYSSATLVKAEFDANGNLYGDYSNGQQQLLYQVPVATFTAPDSLESVTGTEFKQTAAAGTLTVDPANGLNDTQFTPGALETSNVDLGTQFTDMITTQAAYNAATKVFTTADSMLTNVRDLIT